MPCCIQLSRQAEAATGSIEFSSWTAAYFQRKERQLTPLCCCRACATPSSSLIRLPSSLMVFLKNSRGQKKIIIRATSSATGGFLSASSSPYVSGSTTFQTILILMLRSIILEHVKNKALGSYLEYCQNVGENFCAPLAVSRRTK